MFVSGTNGSYLRQTKKAQLRRNGSMIDVHFEDDGVSRWFAIPIEDLRSAVELKNHGDAIEGHIEFDEPSNTETTFRDFQKRNSVSKR